MTLRSRCARRRVGGSVPYCVLSPTCPLRCASSLAILCAITATGCDGSGQGASGRFRDVTLALGLPERQPYADGRYFMPESTGSGVALLDFDEDGDLDIYQVVHPPPARTFTEQLGTPAPNRLYRQEAGGRFREIAAAAGVADPGYGQGVAVGDANGDGRPDLYVTNYGPNHLYLSRGDGTFEDATAQAGLDDKPSLLWGASAAFLDYDRDGRLDLFLVNYVAYDPGVVCIGEANRQDFCGPHRFDGSPGALYRNLGDGTFANVTAAAGVGKAARGFGVACADFTRDGLVDIYVANDRDPNFLWVNRGDGTFVDEALVRGLALGGAGDVESSMGMAVGDADGDGLVDVLVSNLSGETNTLYLAQSGGRFSDRSASAGLGAIDLPFTGWGCGFFDMDNDGDQDLAVVNGRIARGRTEAEGPRKATLGSFWSEYAECSLLFENDGRGSFVRVEAGGGDFTADVGNFRGLALGDLDGDGDVDLVTTELDNHLRVFRNSSPSGNRWLRIRALSGSRDALGALLTVHVAAGVGSPERVLVRTVTAAQSFFSSSDPRVTFGLGAAGVVREVDVLWPDGRSEAFAISPDVVHQELVLREGQGAAR